MLSVLTLAVSLTAGAAPATPASEPAAPKEEARVCRKTEVESGTRLGKRKVCKTAAQWAAEDNRVGRDLDRGTRN